MRLRSWRRGPQQELRIRAWMLSTHPGGQAPRPAGLGRRLWPLAVFTALLAAGCARADLPMDYLDPVGESARVSDHLWNLVFPIAVGVFIVVELGLLLLLIRFRARPGDTTIPKQLEGNARLEVLWTLIPAAILAFIAVPTVRYIFQLSAVPQDAMQINVIGKQYWWEFEYPESEGVVTANEMVIPVGRPIDVHMYSYGQQHEDPLGVIHSFWVPKLAGKQDVVPGHERRLQLIADEPGEYVGQCAEFCGLSHANMRFVVNAVPQEEFDAWVEQQLAPAQEPTDELAQRGHALFEEAQCTACHTINGYEAAVGRVGPNLTNFADREKFAGWTFDNTDENLRAWLDSPQAVKPGAQMPELQLTDDDINALVAYLRTLGSQTQAE